MCSCVHKIMSVRIHMRARVDFPPIRMCEYVENYVSIRVIMHVGSLSVCICVFVRMFGSISVYCAYACVLVLRV